MRQRLFVLMPIVIVMVLVATVGMAAAKPAAPGANPDKRVVVVKIYDYKYVPSVVDILVGTKVIWKNLSHHAHTVTSTAKPPEFDSGNIAPGHSFSFTFHGPVAYPYQCTYHAALGMTGIVEVK